MEHFRPTTSVGPESGGRQGATMYSPPGRKLDNTIAAAISGSRRFSFVGQPRRKKKPPWERRLRLAQGGGWGAGVVRPGCRSRTMRPASAERKRAESLRCNLRCNVLHADLSIVLSHLASPRESGNPPGSRPDRAGLNSARLLDRCRYPLFAGGLARPVIAASQPGGHPNSKFPARCGLRVSESWRGGRRNGLAFSVAPGPSPLPSPAAPPAPPGS